MMNEFRRILENKSPDPAKLAEYGFVSTARGYEYRTSLLDGEFFLHVEISASGIRTEVTDALTGEPYTLYLVAEANGAFVTAVREAVGAVLEEIVSRCYKIVRGGLVGEVKDYLFRTYGDEAEYLWERTPDCAVWRRKDNRKWYGALLFVSARKLGLEEDGELPVLDFRMEPEKLNASVDGKRYFRGYHMNKKSWATVCLDGSLPAEEIFALLDESYLLAADKKKARKGEKTC